MSIQSYFKPKDGLPDPSGLLSSCLPSQEVALANKEVEKVTSDKGKQCGQYRQSYRQCEAIVPPHRKKSKHTLANLRDNVQ